MKTFLRWAGSKRRLLPDLVARLPRDYRDRRHVEPFLGSGALYLHLEPERAHLNDAGRPVFEAWYDPDWRLVGEYGRQIADAKTYRMFRAAYNSGALGITQRASAFIALNHTNFNGLWRVNGDGRMNVPWGKRSPNWDEIVARVRNAAAFAAKHDLTCHDFNGVPAGAGDFLYMDPPYIDESGEMFDAYTQEKWDLATHRAVKRVAVDSAYKGAAVMVSVADTPTMRELWGSPGWNLHSVGITYSVGSTGSRRQPTKELIITSYATP